MTISEQVCDDNGTKVDVVGDHASIDATAPDGFLIAGYCVKAGSAKHGDGPEYVVLEQPVAAVTITHTSGKDVSHYTLDLVPVPVTTKPPTTITEPPTTTVVVTPPPVDVPHPATPIVDRSVGAPAVEVDAVVEVADDPVPSLARTGVDALPLGLLGVALVLLGALLRQRAQRLDRDVVMHDLGRGRTYHNHGAE